ncbi:selenoprotein M-like [Battus philenor]|uniref:selenoprotein M-like n=1 Tax=Battus philenor TaxID=42288 RepID=UPI0035CE95D9
MSLKFNIVLLLLSVLFAVITGYEQSDVASARIESCRGCSLNRLPEVKRFIFEDAPNYERLEVKFITGADPELILLNDGDQELERLPLAHLSRSECNELIQSKGFTKKAKNTEF